MTTEWIALGRHSAADVGTHIRGQVNGPNLIWHVTLAVRLTYNKVTSVQASCYSLMIGDV